MLMYLAYPHETIFHTQNN